MKIVKKITENCHFYIREKLLYIAWACFRNAIQAVHKVESKETDIKTSNRSNQDSFYLPESE